MKKLVLASKSPRRKALMALMRWPFEIFTTDADESFDPSLAPGEVVGFLSRKKSEAVVAAYPGETHERITIGADTIVVIDGEILNKPASHSEAAAMLTKLQGRTHEVYTGFTLIDGLKSLSDAEVTRVTFARMSESEIDDYIRIAQPFDKAGGYGIQDDFGACFIPKIDGCYYNVVGLPLSKLYHALRTFSES
ncbi:MAG: septum formation protein Maf [Rhizobacter sp.]|nr:septum formation protein Maf [Chlorobiales bacterium]